MNAHDWTGPTQTIRYVHCSNCGKIFEINKPKGVCNMDKWISNDPKATSKLKKVDRDYEKALQKAQLLPLMQKVVAIRKAREIRDERYRRVISDAK